MKPILGMLSLFVQVDDTQLMMIFCFSFIVMSETIRVFIAAIVQTPLCEVGVISTIV